MGVVPHRRVRGRQQRPRRRPSPPLPDSVRRSSFSATHGPAEGFVLRRRYPRPGHSHERSRPPLVMPALWRRRPFIMIGAAAARGPRPYICHTCSRVGRRAVIGYIPGLPQRRRLRQPVPASPFSHSSYPRRPPRPIAVTIPLPPSLSLSRGRARPDRPLAREAVIMTGRPPFSSPRPAYSWVRHPVGRAHHARRTNRNGWASPWPDTSPSTHTKSTSTGPLAPTHRIMAAPLLVIAAHDVSPTASRPTKTRQRRRAPGALDGGKCQLDIRSGHVKQIYSNQQDGFTATKPEVPDEATPHASSPVKIVNAARRCSRYHRVAPPSRETRPPPHPRDLLNRVAAKRDCRQRDRPRPRR